MEFNLLVKDTTRNDDYVNATKWCKYFNKRFRDYGANKETKKRWNSIAERVGRNSDELIKAPGRGKRGDTFVHPLIAIDLASDTVGEI
ncbi:hypothetical protein AMR41_30750, partial [Hapalosiphon sp. MRB220]